MNTIHKLLRDATVHTATDIRSLVRPCVYLFLYADGGTYVGKSWNGILRPFSPTHHIHHVPKDHPVKVLLIWVRTKSAADQLETQFIRVLNPALNRYRRRQYPLTQDDAEVQQALQEFIRRAGGAA
jgi:hypothetical protein